MNNVISYPPEWKDFDVNKFVNTNGGAGGIETFVFTINAVYDGEDETEELIPPENISRLNEIIDNGDTIPINVYLYSTYISQPDDYVEKTIEQFLGIYYDTDDETQFDASMMFRNFSELRRMRDTKEWIIVGVE